MKLAIGQIGSSTELVVEQDGSLFRLPSTLSAGTIDDLVRGPETLLAALRDASLTPVEPTAVALTRPAIARPGKILCAGANYHDHIAEMNLPVPTADTPPFLFLKPTTSLVGDGATVVTDVQARTKLDYEVELGVVIGRRTRDVTAADARSCIAGYVVANDVSARGPFRVANPAGPAFAFDWLAHKGQDGFCPVGPWFVPAEDLPDPSHVALRAWVNDELRQDGTTADIISTPERLIEFASGLTTLEPGDLILTGTPAGVGAGSGRFLQDSDVVRVEVDGIGSVATTFRSRRRQ